jgi:hypothetical protein
LQEALNASDDMKAIMGIYDASLGARSNETSGRAIRERKMEGDVSTFHFMDNRNRSIAHTGRILIDLIPHVYPKDRIARVLGQDGTPSQVPLGKPVPVMDDDGNPIGERIYDLGVGKYDLTVTAGPSYATRREEAAEQMTDLIRAFPPAAAVVGPHLAKTSTGPAPTTLPRTWKSCRRSINSSKGCRLNFSRACRRCRRACSSSNRKTRSSRATARSIWPRSRLTALRLTPSA